MVTTCEECGRRLTLNTYDADGVLVGDECACGYYVTRYLPGQAPDDGPAPAWTYAAENLEAARAAGYDV